MIAGDLFDYLVSWVICWLYLSFLSKKDWRSKSRENFEAVPSRLAVSRYRHSAFLKAQPDWYNLACLMWWLLSTSSCVQERLRGTSKISAVCVRSKFLGFMHRLTYDAQKSVSSERPKYVFRAFICQFWPTAPFVAFARMLNEMRYGKLQESTIRIFKTLDRELIYTDGIQPTDM